MELLREKEQLEENGYVVVDVSILLPQIQAARSAALDIFSVISVGLGGGAVRNDKELIEFYKNNQSGQYKSVLQMRGCPEIHVLSGDPYIVKVLKELGVNLPIMESPPNYRCDIPVEEQSIFHKHQDYTYGQGSHDSVTIWLPLQDTSIREGALLVVPGSHKEGIYPNKKGIIMDDYEFDFKPCEIRLGEMLVFNQKVVHQSGRNVSESVRMSLQLRYSNLKDPEFQKREYPINYSIITNMYMNEVDKSN